MTHDLPEDLSPVFQDVERAYPNEGCGIILRAPDGAWRILPLRNAYDDFHAKDPETFPRTGRTAYQFDPKEWLRANQEADRRGESIACVYHSHADVGAYFSAEDKVRAVFDGQPLLPGTSYLVVAVDEGQATAAKLFSWGGADFTEIPLPARLLPRRISEH